MLQKHIFDISRIMQIHYISLCRSPDLEQLLLSADNFCERICSLIRIIKIKMKACHPIDDEIVPSPLIPTATAAPAAMLS